MSEGDINNLNIRQEVRAGDFNSLRKVLRIYKVPKNDIDDLKSIIDNDSFDKESQKFGKKVSNWAGKMFVKAGSGEWKTPASDPGKVLAESLAAYYGF
jgi:hypothetical protein